MTFLKTILRFPLRFPAIRRLREWHRTRYEVTIRPRHYAPATEYGVARNSGRQPQLVVSLTSHPPRIREVVHAINSLLRQSLQPDHLVLWLGEEQFPSKEADLPEELLAQKNLGLSIRWCKDVKCHTKLLPALKAFSDAIIVTADDDIFYPRDWLKSLVASHQLHPHLIYCGAIHHIQLDPHGAVLPYRQWKWNAQCRQSSYLHLLLGYAGVLYPPGCLHEAVSREDLFQTLSPQNDDLWFWAMALLKGTRIQLVQTGRQQTRPFPSSRISPLLELNWQAGNDIQMRQILAHYPQLTGILQSEPPCDNIKG